MTGRERVCAALRHEPVDRLPIWMMRQAGRYLPGYQVLRKQHSFMEMAGSVDLSLEITMEPIHALDVDAAIVFHDILIPFELMGMNLHFEEGAGPVLDPPLRSIDDLNRLKPARIDADITVAQVLRGLRRELGDEKAVFGFAGAPLTLAVYGVEGRLTKNRASFRRAVYEDRAFMDQLLDHLAETVADYLCQQAPHVDMLQIFESHANLLPPSVYAEVGLPALKKAVTLVREEFPDLPIFFFGHGLGHLIPWIADLPFTGYSLGSDVHLGSAREALSASHRAVIQGNLDPAIVLCQPDTVRREAQAFLERTAHALGSPAGSGLPKGWIVNLGDGITPQTPPESAKAFVETVHAFTNA